MSTRVETPEGRTDRALKAALRQGVLVWVVLVALTFVSLAAAYLPLGRWTLTANLAIAVTMVLLVAAFFMNLRRATSLTLTTACAAFLLLLSMFTLTFNDLFTRF